ncbi:hypothetical protein [Halalkalicoccus jeotgali]|uniref:Uncharacterized protein n=1 Tax=Halalkalicoccus jeotgali (strain DSM 18796 / CECT 7217 / JCM 14584 / KCTC 4019 / B3) TaxID=795797 RepID=D8J7C0_HALJB|nr:hypothetical protein [Halalkalicoccus jeotgali]ADJ14015.1 hypothetical protein HacjB3_03110 [Halalkalicoccus jeotgali B3]ELY33939.1 hypothetical protein C497_16197 [Halalkalicoccus jeotgali B3]
MTETSDERLADIAAVFYRDLDASGQRNRPRRNGAGRRGLRPTPSRGDSYESGREEASGRDHERHTDRSGSLGVEW